MSRRRSTAPTGRNGEADMRRVRCAIYTRKSSEEGLDQEFNSLDAQREGAEAFIASQKAEGWICLPERYDDGGFSGGSMERPALARLLRDIDAGGIDKKGWEYVWVRYAEAEDATAGAIVKRPIAVYVERVYGSGDFAGLGI